MTNRQNRKIEQNLRADQAHEVQSGFAMILFSAQLYARVVKRKKGIGYRVQGIKRIDPRETWRLWNGSLLVNIHHLQYVCVCYNHICLKSTRFFVKLHTMRPESLANKSLSTAK